VTVAVGGVKLRGVSVGRRVGVGRGAAEDVVAGSAVSSNASGNTSRFPAASNDTCLTWD